RLSAEHVTTADWFAAVRASIQSVIACSHGSRSASVSGMPACILATIASGWKVSASANRQRRRPASSAPTVVLPLPATPATIRITGVTIRACPALYRVGIVAGQGKARGRYVERWERHLVARGPFPIVLYAPRVSPVQSGFGIFCVPGDRHREHLPSG